MMEAYGSLLYLLRRNGFFLNSSSTVGILILAFVLIVAAGKTQNVHRMVARLRVQNKHVQHRVCMLKQV